MMTGPKFGKEFREEKFRFEPGLISLNHGSFGMAPNAVLDKRLELLTKNQANPEMYIRRHLTPKTTESRNVCSEWLDADPQSLVFVANASHGINTVLRSYPLQAGDKILYPPFVYDAVEMTLNFLKDRYKIEPVMIDVHYPMTNEEIVQAYIDAAEGGDVKMAVFDTVSSNPAIKLPWERICYEMRKRNVLTMVDGAHGIGLIDISLRQAKPDFFVTNAHKWFWLPPSCAVLYVDRAHHRNVHTMPVSHTYLPDDVELNEQQEIARLVDRFDFYGTIDASPMMCIPTADEFYKNDCGGFESARKYREDLALQGGKLVADHLGTEIMELDKLGQHTAMVNVRLPLDDVDDKEAACLALKRYMVHKQGICIPSFVYRRQVWSRWSAQVYLGLEDFKVGIRLLDEALASYKNAPKEHGVHF